MASPVKTPVATEPEDHIEIHAFAGTLTGRLSGSGSQASLGAPPVYVDMSEPPVAALKAAGIVSW